MAKNNNLTDLLTDVANAIREKKGSSDPINPQNFSDEIASIETGGGGGAAVVTESDVNFRDYDGTLLHSYTKSQFLALSELPELPSQPGLVCQEWNWTLSNAQTRVATTGFLEVGASYVTDDNKTRLYVAIPKGRKNVALYINPGGDINIEWGDGLIETISGTTAASYSHEYTKEGNYCIKISSSDHTFTLGYNFSNSVMGSANEYNAVNCNKLLKVELCNNVRFASGAFAYSTNLKAIALPSNLSLATGYMFSHCHGLSYVAIPRATTKLSSYQFEYCYCLMNISIPNETMSAAEYCFRECYGLTKIAILANGKSLFNRCYNLREVYTVGKISESMFDGCHKLSRVISSITVLSAKYCFRKCYSLTYINLSQTTSISAAFGDCRGMACYDFREALSVPSLGLVSAFENIPTDCKIVVPDGLYDSWIAATNWSTYASNIVKASEYAD